jgi:hypothetical protein
MWFISALGSVALIFLTLLDSFETTILPRRITHRFRYARLYYRNAWKLWRWLALLMPGVKARIAFLSLFGPLSLIGLMTNWVFGLILGFAWLHWSLETSLHVQTGAIDFMGYLYLSGTTFFTLGYGDITPITTLGRALAIIEAGLGFGFLAMIIGYLPVIHQLYSRRERSISLLDARAGSPPSASQFLIRLVTTSSLDEVSPFLREWEQWACELLENHLSFQVLGYYRSQHDNQSWLAALTMVLDTCAFLIIEVPGPHCYQAQLTFAMARHAVVDLVLIMKRKPHEHHADRLPVDRLQWLRDELRARGVVLVSDDAAWPLKQVRIMYEPFVNALADYYLFKLPEFAPQQVKPDNWQTSAWMPQAPAVGSFPTAASGETHF